MRVSYYIPFSQRVLQCKGTLILENYSQEVKNRPYCLPKEHFLKRAVLHCVTTSTVLPNRIRK